MLRVDGLKQKCLAAHHAGIGHIVIPRQNEADMAEIPAKIRDQIRVHYVTHVDEALAVAFGEQPRAKQQAPIAAPA